MALTISTLIEGYRRTSLAVIGSLLTVFGNGLALRARNPAGSTPENPTIQGP